MSKGNLIKRFLRKLFRSKYLGKFLSSVLFRLGAVSISKRCSKYSKFVPKQVRVEIDSTASVTMDSLDGNDHVARLLWLNGLQGFEAPLPALYIQMVQDLDVIIGVGANSGFYELITAAKNDHARIIAFEPYPPAIKCFKNNLFINNITHRVDVVEKAVSDQIGELEFYIPEIIFGDTLETSASLMSDFRESHSDILTVPAITLDSFISDSKFERVQLIRVDVEGAEHLVVKGCINSISAYRPIVVLELLIGSNISSIFEVFSEVDYVFVYFDHQLQMVIGEDLSVRESNSNQIMCPREKVSGLTEMAQRASIAIVSRL